MVSIVDSGIGNVGSIVSMHDYLGLETVVIKHAEEVASARKLILPGVGSYDAAIDKLTRQDLFHAIKDRVNEGAPILGICLGMQLLMEGSEEGLKSGFSFINGHCKKFDNKLNLPIPHLGWNTVGVKKNGNQLFPDVNEYNRFYFVHSFYACVSNEDILTTTDYGVNFASSIHSNNVYGVQFHPEKSHRFGLSLLNRFYYL